MDARGAQLIILTAGEEALGIALVDDKDDFGCHLSTQERCLLHTRDAGILPLGEVLGRLDCLDACGRLAEAAVALVQARVGAGNLEVWVGRVWLHHVLGGGDEERVDAVAAEVVLEVSALAGDWGVGAWCGHRGGEV